MTRMSSPWPVVGIERKKDYSGASDTKSVVQPKSDPTSSDKRYSPGPNKHYSLLTALMTFSSGSAEVEKDESSGFEKSPSDTLAVD